MTAPARQLGPERRPPRLDFLGLGWIGRMRFESMVRDGGVSEFAVADLDPSVRAAALGLCPSGREMTVEAMLEDPSIEGIVIATPSGCHARQTVAALRAGKAVFCQKPLGRNAEETSLSLDEARKADRALHADMCYLGIDGVRRMRDVVQSGELGPLYAIEATFHNAYSPSANWAYDPELSGGGCLLDLGTHLLDLIFWTTGAAGAEVRAAQLRCEGRPWRGAGVEVEDYASASLTLPGGVAASVTCSWNLHAGRDAVFGVRFYGARGGVGLRNVDGSFYEFDVERYDGARSSLLGRAEAEWSAATITRWAQQVSRNPCFDPEVERLVDVARALDAIYAAAAPERPRESP